MESHHLGDTVHSETGLHVSPDPVMFGTICHGYVYTMNVKLQNHTRNSVRVKAEISPLRLEDEKNEASLSYVPIQIAPGISTTMSIRINCNYSGTYLFKNMTKQLAVHNKKILLDNVSSLSRVPGGSQFFSGTRSPGQLEASAATASTIYTTELLDHDDIDELSDIPLMSYTYWDLAKGRMFLDRKLLEIVIDPSIDLKASKKQTRDNREVRLSEIESQGCYTKRGVEQVVESRNANWGNDLEGTMGTGIDVKEIVDAPASNSEPFAGVTLKEPSGSTVITEGGSKDNPYGHIRGARALGSVHGRIPSTKHSRNKSIGSAGALLSPSSPLGAAMSSFR